MQTDLLNLQELIKNIEPLPGAGAIVLLFRFVLTPFFKFCYNDFLRDFWKKRLELKNELYSNIISSKHTVDLIEGQYHLLARHLISVIYRIEFVGLDEDSLLGELRTSMADIFSKTISALHPYQYRDNHKKLDLHLRSMTHDEKTEFYMPIVKCICSGADSSKIRNIVLGSIDQMISCAIEKILLK